MIVQRLCFVNKIDSSIRCFVNEIDSYKYVYVSLNVVVYVRTGGMGWDGVHLCTPYSTLIQLTTDKNAQFTVCCPYRFFLHAHSNIS